MIVLARQALGEACASALFLNGVGATCGEDLSLIMTHTYGERSHRHHHSGGRTSAVPAGSGAGNSGRLVSSGATVRLQALGEQDFVGESCAACPFLGPNVLRRDVLQPAGEYPDGLGQGRDLCFQPAQPGFRPGRDIGFRGMALRHVVLPCEAVTGRAVTGRGDQAVVHLSSCRGALHARSSSGRSKALRPMSEQRTAVATLSDRQLWATLAGASACCRSWTRCQSANRARSREVLLGDRHPRTPPPVAPMRFLGCRAAARAAVVVDPENGQLMQKWPACGRHCSVAYRMRSTKCTRWLSLALPLHARAAWTGWQLRHRTASRGPQPSEGPGDRGHRPGMERLARRPGERQGLVTDPGYSFL